MKRWLIVASLIVVAGAVSLLFNKKVSTSNPFPTVSSTLNSTDQIGSSVEYYKNIKGYYIRPSQDQKMPGVIIIHDEQGFDEQTKILADKLAADGFQVLAIDLFANGNNASNIDQVEAVSNMKSAIAFLKDNGAENIGIVGFGFGGYEALLLSVSDGDLDAIVIYYGRPIINEGLLSQVPAPILGLYAKDDATIPLINVEKMESSFVSMGFANDIVIYPDTKHGFADPNNPDYNKTAADNAWAKTLLFFEENLKLIPMP